MRSTSDRNTSLRARDVKEDATTPGSGGDVMVRMVKNVRGSSSEGA